MGADQVENTIICPYCCKRIKCEGFQELVNLNDTGGYVQHSENTSHVGKADRSISAPQDNFILHNPKHMKMVSADLLTQLDPKKIPCPRCRAKIDEAQKLLNKGICIDPTNVARICDHCFLKSQIQTNKRYGHNFLVAHGEQDEYSKKYNKDWLTNMANELSKAISELRTQKKPRRTYSDIDIDLLNRDAPGPVIKCTVQEMFHSDVNLLESHRPEKAQRLKKQVLAVERAVNFTEKIETFQTLGSESSLQINVEKQDQIDSRLGPHPSIEQGKYHHTPAESLQYEEITKPKKKAEEMQRDYEKSIPSKTEKIIDYSRLGPRSSIEEEKYHHAPAESLQYEESTKQKKKGEEMEKVYEKSVQSRTEKIIDYDLEEKTSFFFPESFHKADTKLKRRVSSSELIKDTQEKIRLKAKEEEEKMIEKLKLKAELKEKKKRDREEKEKLAREEKEKLAREIKEKLAREEKEKLAREEKAKLAREEKEKLTREEKIKEKSKVNEAGTIKTKSSDTTSKIDKTDLLEQKGKMKKGGVEEELEQKSASEAKKGKIKKDAFKEESAEKRETTQSKGKDKSDVLEQNKKLKKGAFEEGPDTTHTKKQDMIEEKNKTKLGGLKKEPEEKQTTLQSKERDKSSELKKTEGLKEKELKLAEVKLQKQSIDKLGSQLVKVKKNESEKEHSAIQTKKQEELNKLIESSKKRSTKEDGVEEKRDDPQTKLEKANKKEAMQEKDLKMTQVKLVKASADDLGQLAKVKKNIPGTLSKSKEPEISKMLLESAKRKEALVDKAPRFEGPKKKDDKSALVDTKETKERELKMNQVKMAEPSIDNVILKLIRIRSGKKLNTVDDQPSKSKSAKRSARVKKKKVGEDEINLIEEESSIEYKNQEEITQPKKEKRKGSLEFQPPHRDGQDIIPIYITHELSEISSSAPLGNVDDAKLAVEDGKKVDPETSKGVIRYALSDRTFIEKGWTMLPVEKVVRKMNIYRMRPAQPEFDWFEHNKHKGLMLYDTGTKLAEFDKDGRGRWFYQNGRLALDYYEAEETNTQQRFVVYSNGEQDERGRSRPVTILATFDHLGNGVVFDHAGKIRLKYNQTEGVLLDRSIGPSTNWKWHTLNDPPVLQQVMIDTQMPLKDPKILKMGGPADNRTRPDNEEMLAIEFDNFIKEKSKKLTQKFKPFQIRMKALKINENFSLKVLDQATIYLIFRDGSANLKVNIGMILDHKEIVDTDTAELGEVSNSLERLPARTDSLAALQSSIANARRFERIRTERERRLRHPEPCLSADELGKAASRPLKPPLRTLPTSPKGSIEQYKCSRKQSSNLYYSTQLL